MNERDRISSLVREISANRSEGTPSAGTSRPEGNDDERTQVSRTADDIVKELLPHHEFHFDDDTIKQNLDEILLMLIAMRDGGSHGKRLMNDLAVEFGARLSPGTVYPSLHELEDDGTLAMHEKVRTKEYHIDDEQEARERLQNVMYQHLALGFMMHITIDEL